MIPHAACGHDETGMARLAPSRRFLVFGVGLSAVVIGSAATLPKEQTLPEQ